MTAKSSVYLVSALLFVCQFVLSNQARAQQASSSDLDLSSSNRTVTAGSGQSGTITVGGASVTVTPGTLLTPAESVALGQVLGGGTQNLVLDASGKATGGSFILTGASYGSLVIPQGVSAVRDFGTSGTLSLAGNLSNSGSLYALSTSAATMTALVSAQNITNFQTGLLTSVTQGNLFGFSNLVSGLNLSLSAIQNITNYGVISSAGNLNLTAGGSIVNALPAGVSGSSPIMQALGNINMLASAVQNAGLVTSLSGNINVASQLVQNLTIDNSGIFQALNGSINIRDSLFSGKVATSLLGGDWLSKELNVFSGSGLISLDVNSILGQVNLIGGDAYLTSRSGDLHIGAMQMSGDPTISANGDILLERSSFGGEWVFSGSAPLILNATGSIINRDVSMIGTMAGSGATGDITMTAGGSIDLATVPISTISTSTSNGNSGNITLTAGGPILLAGSISTNTTNGRAGSVTINSNGNLSTSGNLAIDTSSVGGNAGNISISAGSGIAIAGGMELNASSSGAVAGTVSVISSAGDIAFGNAQSVVNARTANLQTAGNIVLPSSLSVSKNTALTLTASTIGLKNIVLADGAAVHLLGDKSVSLTDTSGTLTSWLDISAPHISAGNLSSGVVTLSDRNNTFSSMNVGSIDCIGQGFVSVNINSAQTLSYGTNIGDISNAMNIFLANAGSGGVSVDKPLVASNTADNDTSNFNTISLSSNAGTVAVNALVRSGLTLAGASGNISIYADAVKLNADLVANGTGVGRGGNVGISANSLQLNGGNIYASGGGSNSHGGFINLTSYTPGTGSLNISGTDLLCNANGYLGIVNVYTGQLNLSNHVTMTADAISTGAGGKVIVAATEGSLALGSASGQFSASAQGGTLGGNGGTVRVSAGGDLSVSTASMNVAAPGSGKGGTIDLSAGGINPNSHLTIAGQLIADGGANYDGGSISLSGPTIDFTGTQTQVISANGTGVGAGGTISLASTYGFNSTSGSSILVSANGGSGGNGGSVAISSSDPNATLNIGQSGSNSFAVTATGGAATSVQGDGGSVTLHSGGSLNLAGAGVSVAVLGQRGQGGTLDLSTSAGDISLAGTYSVNGGSQGGDAGSLTVNAGGKLSNTGSLDVSAFASSGTGGTVAFSAGSDLNLSSATLNSGSGSGNAGSISLLAGAAGNGSLTVDGSVLANGGGTCKGGDIVFSQNSALSMQIGVSQSNGQAGSGLISASNLNGSAGTLTLSGGSSALNVSLNQAVSLLGASNSLGDLTANSSAAVNVSGPASLNANLNGSGSSYRVDVAGAGSTLGVKNVSTSKGDLVLRASASDGALVFQSGSTLSASQGNIQLGAPSMSFKGNSTITMDNAGVLKVDSGNQTSSLNIDLQSGSVVTFNMSQGSSLRPGIVEMGPNGSGALNINSNGAASLEFTGGTVSMVSSSGDINLGSGVAINSDAFDSTLNIGMEVVATNGNVNLNSPISARQLNVSTVGTGNINLGGDINSPTVVLSVQGNSTINQTGSGSLGIGTLVLNSQLGDIGSSVRPLETNVLELQVNSGASAYINNASTVDIKTSNVAGSFQLSNDGDVAMESNVTAGALSVNSTGSISIFNAVDGTNGVTLASAAGAANNIQVAAGGSLSASAGSISLSTDNLILDGVILAQGAGSSVSINSSGNLVLSGGNASISAGGGNNLIDLSGSNSVNFTSSYTLNAGSNGTVQIQTASLSSGGVSLSNSASLSAAGGSQLNIFSNSLSLSSGSTMNLSNAQNAMTVQSSAGAPLTVSVTGSNAINASAGGTVSFLAGLGGALNFNNTSAGTGNLNVNGAALATSSTAANTNLNSVNLNSNRNIDIGVHGATLNLNGNVTSSQNNGVIVLRDPAGITISGNGTVGFAQGLHGLIAVQALSVGADLQFAGNPHFDAGSGGTVSFDSIGSITFAAGSNTTINSGATLNMSAPLINFGSGAQVMASGASNINVSGYNSSTVDFVVPDASTGTISTNGGGQIIITTGSGFDIGFHHNLGGSALATLNLLGAPVTIRTTNADVTIDANVVVHTDNNVNVIATGGNFVNNGQLQSPTQGTTTYIESAGPVVVDKNINANSLVIRTTANNGNITLGADVNVVKDLTVSADGSGNIIQTAGLLSAASISLSSISGNIGSATGAIKVSTTNLSVSTAGSAYVSAQGAVRVDSFNVGGGLNLKAGGDIAVGAANASALSINSNATFNAGRAGTVTVAASDLVSIASGVSLKVQDSALNLSAANINIGNSAKINSTGNLTVNGNVTGTDFKVGTGSGNLLVNGDVSGRSIGFSSSGAGNITFNGNVNASRLLTVSAGDRGNISQLSGVLGSSKIELSSGSGNIGSSASALNVAASSLSARTEGKGIVNVRANGNLVLDNSRSGGNFSVAASGNLTVNDVETERGSISLTGSGAVNVAQNAEIHANQGNLSILNTNASAGTITIGKNAELVALSDSSSNGLGNVTIAIGSVPASPVKGSAPSGLKVSEKYGGKAYFGSNGITVNGKNNEVNAWGSNVVFSTGARPKSAISLEGGVYILADPPVAGVGASAPLQESAAVLSPVTGTGVQFNSVNSLVPTGFSQANYVFNQSAMTVPAPKTQEIERIESSVNESSELKSVACVTGISATALQGNVSKEVIEKSNTATSSVYTNSRVYESADSCLTFHNGEMMVNAHHQTEIKAANYKLKVDAGSTVLLKSEAGKGIEIYNVYEKHWGGVKVSVDGREFVLGAGQRLVADKECSVAARNEKSHRVAERTVKVAEFPLISLIANSDILGKLIHSSMKEDRQLGARLMKMAACLSVVTSSHGAYKD